MKSHEDFVKEVKEVMGEDYEVLEQYKGARIPIKVKHCCGYIYEVAPTNILRKRGCPKCSYVLRAKEKLERGKNKNLKLIKEICNNEGYEMLEEYKGYKTKAKFKHIKCERVLEMDPEHFIRGQRCKCESKSYGELFISRWLDEHKVIYDSQVRFEDCRYKQPLPFDFRIWRKDGTFFLIEFDGAQHFTEREDVFWETLKERQLKDSIKTKYCENKNIELYRIPYTMFERISKSNNHLKKTLTEMINKNNVQRLVE